VTATFPTRRAANRAGRGRRIVPCPAEKREAIVTRALLFDVGIDRDKRIDRYIDYFGSGAERAASSYRPVTPATPVALAMPVEELRGRDHRVAWRQRRWPRDQGPIVRGPTAAYGGHEEDTA
jgi:hypothetical protein